MGDEVAIEVEDHGSYTVVRATGYLDVSTSPRLRDRLQEVASRPPRTVLLDLGPVEFLDSSALGVVLHGWKLIQAEGGTLAVVSPQERITKLFEITALNLSIKLYSSIAEALAELHPA